MSKKHPGRARDTGPKPPCKVEGCMKPFFAKGFCSTHYMYLRRGVLDENGNRLKEPQRIARYEPGAQCIVDGCTEFPRSRGMCNKHMLQREAGIIDEQGNQLRELLPTGRKRERESWISSTRDGYVVRVAPEGHPFARADGTILEHRLVMEQHLGCYLDPDEWLVHHKHGNRTDNRIEELEVLSARAKKGEGHPPGSAVNAGIAFQILLQQGWLSEEAKTYLAQLLEFYKTNILTRPTPSS